jgi:hypothetical protein
LLAYAILSPWALKRGELYPYFSPPSRVNWISAATSGEHIKKQAKRNNIFDGCIGKMDDDTKANRLSNSTYFLWTIPNLTIEKKLYNTMKGLAIYSIFKETISVPGHDNSHFAVTIVFLLVRIADWFYWIFGVIFVARNELTASINKPCPVLFLFGSCWLFKIRLPSKSKYAV